MRVRWCLLASGIVRNLKKCVCVAVQDETQRECIQSGCRAEPHGCAWYRGHRLHSPREHTLGVAQNTCIRSWSRCSWLPLQLALASCHSLASAVRGAAEIHSQEATGRRYDRHGCSVAARGSDRATAHDNTEAGRACHPETNTSKLWPIESIGPLLMIWELHGLSFDWMCLVELLPFDHISTLARRASEPHVCSRVCSISHVLMKFHNL